MELRFEHLICWPADELSRLCMFIGVEFDEAMLGYDLDSTYDAPDSTMLHRWKGQLSDRDMQLIDGRVGRLL